MTALKRAGKRKNRRSTARYGARKR